MKKYSVYVVFSDGGDLQFETDTNVKLTQPKHINGGEFIVTQEEYMINLLHVKEMNMVTRR